MCVTNTTKLQKDYIFKMSFFLWLETVGFSVIGKKSLSRCILTKWMSARPIHVVAIWRLLSHAGESVLPLRRNCVKRGRVFEDDVFIENTCLGSGSKRRTKIYARTQFYAGHVVLLVNGFPRLNMCTSAIFVVGTSGIPPKLNYRSVKSYRLIENKYDQVDPILDRQKFLYI